jgi:hypothetical protein
VVAQAVEDPLLEDVQVNRIGRRRLVDQEAAEVEVARA